MKILHRKQSSWGRIKTFINTNYEVGDIVKRQTVEKNLRFVPISTFDAYRNQLQSVGILKFSGRGKYRLLHKIPEQMNTIVLFSMANDINRHKWKKWFISFEDRLDLCLNRYK